MKHLAILKKLRLFEIVSRYSWQQVFMSLLILISVLIALLGLAFAVSGTRRLFQHHFLSGIGLEFSGLFFLLLASSVFFLGFNLHTYQRLVFEQVVAEVSFEQQANQEYRADIKVIDTGYQQTVNLKGDEWQLETQVLTWRGIATLFGLDANYRLHQISGRYLESSKELQPPDMVFPLTKNLAYIDNEELDLWQFAHKHQDWLRWVDAVYDRAMFLPMTDGARYEVANTRTGLIVRPANNAARKAISQWISLSVDTVKAVSNHRASAVKKQNPGSIISLLSE